MWRSGNIQTILTNVLTILGFHNVPSADSVDNSQIRDVVGNKTDTVGGNSLVSLNKINKAAIDALNDLSSADIETACTNSLNTYDPPTRAELTSDINSVIVEVDANETKIDNVKTVVDTINTYTSSNDSSGTYAYTDAGGEQTIIEITNTTRKIIQGIWLDFVNITLTGTIKLYYKIDGSNYREFNSSNFDAAVDSDGVYFNLNMGITEDFKVTYTEGADEGASRNIPYSIIYETKE